MAKPAKPKQGLPVSVKSRPIAFSYWPTYKTIRRYGLHSHVYATNPWAVINTSVRGHCPAAARDEALSSIEQAEFFFRAAVGSREWAAKPLPLYYSFLNLAKAFALTRGVRPTFDQAQHGISEQVGPGGVELSDAFLVAFPSPSKRGPNLFDDFNIALGGSPIGGKLTLPLLSLIPQVVPGHRLWCDAADSDERFLAVDSIPFFHSSASKEIWASVRIARDDIERVGRSHKDLLKQSRLGTIVREVEGVFESPSGRHLVCLEQKVPLTYTGRTTDKLAELVKTIRPFIWSTATTIRPFRRYYVYAAPVSEHPHILPQALSIYAVCYYLGSITRYRPQMFARIISGTFGEFFQEFLTSQPSQFVYLMASDFAKRDVAKAPLV